MLLENKKTGRESAKMKGVNTNVDFKKWCKSWGKKKKKIKENKKKLKSDETNLRFAAVQKSGFKN